MAEEAEACWCSDGSPCGECRRRSEPIRVVATSRSLTHKGVRVYIDENDEGELVIGIETGHPAAAKYHVEGRHGQTPRFWLFVNEGELSPDQLAAAFGET